MIQFHPCRVGFTGSQVIKAPVFRKILLAGLVPNEVIKPFGCDKVRAESAGTDIKYACKSELLFV
jgi:hypothetical protein